MVPTGADGLEPAGDVDRVAPQVVDELGRADHAGHDRAAMQPDPDLPRVAGVADGGLHGEREVSRGPDVVTGRPGQPGGGHVRVADRLDLLDAERRAGRVEGREQRVERGHQLPDLEPRRDLGEPDEVAEDDRDVVVPVGDELLALPEPLDDRLRQDVEQERARAGLLRLQLATDPVEEPQVGVADRLDILELSLESPQPPREPGDLLLERLGRPIPRHRRPIAHVPSRRVTNVSLK